MVTVGAHPENCAHDPGTRVVRALVRALGAYWLAYAAVTPVTVTDGHLYNQARLYVIRQQGLFSPWLPAQWMQLAFPWTFDAVHWPFVLAGAGVALPSFACLAGVLAVVFRAVRRDYGADTAWRSVLALLALPTLVYQGTSTKNDIAVVFAAFAWWHAMRRWLAAGRPLHLVASAMAIAFAAGSKTSGLALAPPLTLASLWWLRRRRRALAAWLLCGLLSAIALGSIETYAASLRAFGHPLGPRGLESLANRDGVAGAAANLIRHLLGNIDPGIDRLPGIGRHAQLRLEPLCRTLLEAAGLRGKGHASGSSDARLDFAKTGHEAADGFGPLGTLALLAIPWLLATHSPRSGPWKLAAAALVTLAGTSWLTGYGPWQNRFLLLPFTLATLALVLALDRPWRRHGAVRAAGLALLVFGAVAMPAFSFNRRPQDLWLAVADRDRFTTREAPHLLPVIETVRAYRARCPDAIWVVVPRPGTWELLWYQALGSQAVIAPAGRFTPFTPAELAERHPGRSVFVLALDPTVTTRPPLEPLASFPSDLPAAPIRLFGQASGGCDPRARSPRREAGAGASFGHIRP